MKNCSDFKIGDIVIDGFFGLAPMAGVGDAAFRSVCRRFGAAYTVSEMISAKAICYGDKKTKALLSLGESPDAVQIFGNEPGTMAEAAQTALELSGAKIVDLNMGCPANKIISAGDGAALMKDAALAADVIGAVRRAVKSPVTVKFRSGWDDEHINAPEFAKMAEEAGCDALCIHGRTAKQQYSGRADIALMEKVVSAVKIPVMVNGDVTDAESGMRLLNETGARFALIGRGALGNPWIFRECDAAARGESIPLKPTLRERLGVFICQTELATSLKGEKIACAEARTHFCHYLKGFKNAAKYRNEATNIVTLAEIRKLAEKILSDSEKN